MYFVPASPPTPPPTMKSTLGCGSCPQVLVFFKGLNTPNVVHSFIITSWSAGSIFGPFCVLSNLCVKDCVILFLPMYWTLNPMGFHY